MVTFHSSYCQHIEFHVFNWTWAYLENLSLLTRFRILYWMSSQLLTRHCDLCLISKSKVKIAYKIRPRAQLGAVGPIASHVSQNLPVPKQFPRSLPVPLSVPKKGGINLCFGLSYHPKDKSFFRGLMEAPIQWVSLVAGDHQDDQLACGILSLTQIATKRTDQAELCQVMAADLIWSNAEIVTPCIHFYSSNTVSTSL